MYRIDEFLKYYDSLKDCQGQIAPGVWVNMRPLPFYYGIFTKEYWKERRERKKDAKAVMSGKAVAVTWSSDFGK
jgi:hypothetical protein